MHETLEQYVERIKGMSKAEREEAGVNLELDLQIANCCRQIQDEISFDELKLLFYIQNSSIGDFHRFYTVAKQIYEAHCAFLKLKNQCLKEIF